MTAGPYTFSPRFRLDEADALLCEWAPSAELLAFAGPKAWYCCEPVTRYPGYRSRPWQSVLRRLPSTCAFTHLHPDPACRIPHVTHWTLERPAPFDNPRLARGVAVVSNPGWERLFRRFDTRQRLAFITHPSVDLFGSRERWARFRRFPPFSPAGAPPNYKGELEGHWGLDVKIRHLAAYKACVCLENTCEPFYFTEKFVDAARAGCIPVYHAHPTVKNGVLAGARWIDPEDLGFSPGRPLEAALAADPREFQAANTAWLRGDALRATRTDVVFASLADRLFQPSSTPPSPPLPSATRESLLRAFSRLRVGAELKP
jgi:hypothetical protein